MNVPRPDSGRPSSGGGAPRHVRRRPPRGMTFIEVVTVMTVMSVLFVMAAPSFRRTIEQAHADIAGANLRAIWNAERFYWLENRVYTTNLAELQAEGLLDGAVVNGNSRYAYSVSSADNASFTAVATRINSSRWSGSFEIDETGDASGVVKASGHPDITPGFN